MDVKQLRVQENEVSVVTSKSAVVVRNLQVILESIVQCSLADQPVLVHRFTPMMSAGVAGAVLRPREEYGLHALTRKVLYSFMDTEAPGDADGYDAP